MADHRPARHRTELLPPALVIAGTAVLWLALNALGQSRGWGNRAFALIDLAAIAGFVWALVVTFWIWRRRPSHKKG